MSSVGPYQEHTHNIINNALNNTLTITKQLVSQAFPGNASVFENCIIPMESQLKRFKDCG